MEGERLSGAQRAPEGTAQARGPGAPSCAPFCAPFCAPGGRNGAGDATGRRTGRPTEGRVGGPPALPAPRGQERSLADRGGARVGPVGPKLARELAREPARAGVPPARPDRPTPAMTARLTRRAALAGIAGTLAARPAWTQTAPPRPLLLTKASIFDGHSPSTIKGGDLERTIPLIFKTAQSCERTGNRRLAISPAAARGRHGPVSPDF